jgi:hypothetical protein
LRFISDIHLDFIVPPDNKDFNGSIPTPIHSIREEKWMKKDDGTFFEDDNEEDQEDLTFPDEDEVEEVDQADYEDIEEVFSDRSTKRSEGFILDPWPRIVFVLTIIGLGVVLLTPPGIWALWNYFILADYFLIVLVGVAIVFSLITWSKAGTHRLRWAGPTNVIVSLICGAIGTLDTVSWMLSGTSLFVGIDTPLISLCMVFVVFSLYTLWLVQRSFGPQQR